MRRLNEAENSGVTANRMLTGGTTVTGPTAGAMNGIDVLTIHNELTVRPEGISNAMTVRDLVGASFPLDPVRTARAQAQQNVLKSTTP